MVHLIIGLISLIGAAAATAVAAEDYSFISRHLAARSPYDQERAPVEDLISKQYDIEQMQLFMRHGVRYPSSSDIKDIQDIVKKLQGSTLPHVSSRLAQYDPKDQFPNSQADELTKTGVDDHFQIGQRLGRKYTEFRSSLDLKKVQNLSSHVNRSIISGESFTKGFWQDGNAPPLVSIPAKQDKTIDTLANCPKYDQQVGSKPKEEMLRYYATTFQATAQRLSKELGVPDMTTDDVYKLWYTCAYRTSIYKQVHPFCDYFTREELLNAEYALDIKYSFKYAYGSEEIATGIACREFQEMVGTLRNASQIQFVLKHGHSKTVLPLLTKLGIHRDDFELTADATSEQIKNRQFRTSHDDMYGAHFMIQLLKDKASTKRYVRALLSEIPTVIPGCEEELCPLERFMEIAEPLLDCDYDDICRD
ncbi:hypothetical protein LRAMOSA09423 [Lichtheimia ramosa]|uniref:Multiple inositol polyphosphate phosphatase 1 n=1 Tax=Lichtheimia ramosa TaxID=688394 RepID=A0A077WHP8_9FUNG|nr:hypothetical protein LRAMOSA09423 [Lichtheimia ramosa]